MADNSEEKPKPKDELNVVELVSKTNKYNECTKFKKVLHNYI